MYLVWTEFCDECYGWVLALDMGLSLLRPCSVTALEVRFSRPADVPRWAVQSANPSAALSRSFCVLSIVRA